MIKINIESKKEERDKQKQDIATYYSIVDCLLKKIKEAGLHMSWIDLREGRKKPKENLEISVELMPSSFDLCEDGKLERLYIKVHKEKALNIVENVLKEYSDKYDSIEADINTYF